MTQFPINIDNRFGAHRATILTETDTENRMTTKKKKTVLSWIMLIIILLAMLSYVLMYINGAPEGEEEMEAATTQEQNISEK